jgi:hypothetical protein
VKCYEWKIEREAKTEDLNDGLHDKRVNGGQETSESIRAEEKHCDFSKVIHKMCNSKCKHLKLI